MQKISEQRLFEALATVCHACGGDGLPQGEGEEVRPIDPETREVLAEAALATAYGAFAAQGGDSGAMHMLIGAMGLMAVRMGEEPDPPAEIMGLLAEDAQVEAEIDRAGEAVDREFGRDLPPERMTAAMEARILGTAITLAGCTLPEGVDGQAAVRLRAARLLARLAAGLLAMNAAGGAARTAS